MAWSRAQGTTAGNVVSGGSVSSQTATFASALTNPSLIVVTVFYGGSTTTLVSSITDTAGNSYSRATGGADSTNSQAEEVWYGINSHTTASNVVTVHFSPNASEVGVIIDEYTGGGTSPTLDKTAITVRTTASPGPYTSASVTTTANGELCHGTFIQDATTSNTNAITANSPFTIGSRLSSSTNGNFASEWDSQATAGAINATFSWTHTGASGEIVGIITFTATSGNVTVALTGSSMTATAGTLSESGTANVTISGSSMTATAGNLSATGGASVALTGSSIAATAGLLSITGDANVPLSGSSITSAAGTLSITGTANVTLVGSSLTATPGTLTVSTGVNITVAITGQSMTATSGTLSMTGDANVSLTGSSIVSTAGTITVTVPGAVAAHYIPMFRRRRR